MNDKDEKTFLLAEAIGEAEEKYIAEEKKLGRMKAGTKAGIFFAVILAAALILGGVASLKAKRRIKMRGDAPLVTFSDLAPQVMKITKNEIFFDTAGEVQPVRWTREITEQDFQRRVLALLDEAKIRTDRETEYTQGEAPAAYEPNDGVTLYIEEDGLIYEFGISHLAVSGSGQEMTTTVLVAMPETEKHKAKTVLWECRLERAAFEQLFNELWDYSGGRETFVIRSAIDRVPLAESSQWTRPEGRPIAPDHPLKETDRGGIWDEFREGLD